MNRIEIVNVVKPPLPRERAGGIKRDEILPEHFAIQRFLRGDAEISDAERADEQRQRNRTLQSRLRGAPVE